MADGAGGRGTGRGQARLGTAYTTSHQRATTRQVRYIHVTAAIAADGAGGKRFRTWAGQPTHRLHKQLSASNYPSGILCNILIAIGYSLLHVFGVVTSCLEFAVNG